MQRGRGGTEGGAALDLPASLIQPSSAMAQQHHHQYQHQQHQQYQHQQQQQHHQQQQYTYAHPHQYAHNTNAPLPPNVQPANNYARAYNQNHTDTQRQQQPPQPQQQPMVAPSVTVDGAGLWANFTRTFRTPIEALLDILDNAVDAGFTDDGNANGKANANANANNGFHGKIRIDEDEWNCSTPSENRGLRVLLKTSSSDGNGHGNTGGASWPELQATKQLKSGILIRNNSSKPITNINEILTVFHSAKGDASESIGQNGVGLKQGCAAIANLSFICIKNGPELSLGLVAKDLQKVNQNPIFPRFELSKDCVMLFKSDADADGNGNGNGNQGEGSEAAAAQQQQRRVKYLFRKKKMQEELREICNGHNGGEPDVGACVATYGGGDMELGILRLATHFEKMFHDHTWSSESYVFTLIMHQIRQQGASIKVEFEDGDFGCDRDRYILGGIFDELKESLPKTYIHIPDSFDFRVCGEKVLFRYWQKRLVELTSAEQKISKSVPLSEIQKFEYPPGHWYELRMFLGFDAIRTHDNEQHKSLAMHVYSRKSGRLVLSSEDARSDLRLSTSGTDYGQGLTLIVDDYEGNLTLNPRKDGIAFGEEQHPNTHKNNLYQFLGVIAKSYWMFHANKFKSNPKSSLTAYLKPFAEKFIAEQEDANESSDNSNSNSDDDSENSLTLPRFSTGDFTKMDGVYNYYLHHGKTLTCRVTGAEQYIGTDTAHRITPGGVTRPQKLPKPKAKPKASASDKPKAKKSKKRKAGQSSSSHRITSRTSKTVVYLDDSDDDDDEDSDCETSEGTYRTNASRTSAADKILIKGLREDIRNKEKQIRKLQSDLERAEENCRGVEANALKVGTENEETMINLQAAQFKVGKLMEDREALRQKNLSLQNDNHSLRMEVQRLRGAPPEGGSSECGVKVEDIKMEEGQEVIMLDL